jgi:hypothetical protein
LRNEYIIKIITKMKAYSFGLAAIALAEISGASIVKTLKMKSPEHLAGERF